MPVSIILDFLEFAGIRYKIAAINSPAFLPGLQMLNGTLVIDTDKLLYPGDILHEAGHLATMPPGVRETMSDTLMNNDLNRGGEMMAIAWSYAACVYLGIDPRIVFHDAGYKGGNENLLNNFADGKYLGLPLLQWAGMACDEKKAAELNEMPYPHMIRWLREY